MTARIRRSLCLAVGAGSLLFTTALPSRAGVVDQPVKTTNANELGGAADGEWLGWSEAPSDHAADYRALASKQGANPISLGAPGRVAFVGGIAGTTAVFQQTRPARTRTSTATPSSSSSGRSSVRR